MRLVALLMIQLCFELFIFPKVNIQDRLLSRKNIHFLSILNTVYSTNNTLKNTKYAKILPIVIISLDYLFGKFLIASFYDSSCKYFDSMHSLVIIVISMLPFLFIARKEDLEEYESHSMASVVHRTLANIIFVYKLFYFYKHFHLKHGNIIEFCFNIQLLVHFTVDFLTNNTTYVMNNLLCYYLANKKTKTKKHIWNIFRKFFLMILANFAFYSIYSFKIAKGLFDYVNNSFSQPMNLILYNTLPKDLDQRFRICLYIFNWILSL